MLALLQRCLTLYRKVMSSWPVQLLLLSALLWALILWMLAMAGLFRTDPPLPLSRPHPAISQAAPPTSTTGPTP